MAPRVAIQGAIWQTPSTANLSGEPPDYSRLLLLLLLLLLLSHMFSAKGATFLWGYFMMYSVAHAPRKKLGCAQAYAKSTYAQQHKHERTGLLGCLARRGRMSPSKGPFRFPLRSLSDERSIGFVSYRKSHSPALLNFCERRSHSPFCFALRFVSKVVASFLAPCCSVVSKGRKRMRRQPLAQTALLARGRLGVPAWMWPQAPARLVVSWAGQRAPSGQLVAWAG